MATDRLSLANAKRPASIDRSQSGSRPRSTTTSRRRPILLSFALELTSRIDLIEHRLLTRLGGMIVVATGIPIAIKYFG